MPDDKPIAAQIAEACGWEWENAKDSPTHILVRVDGHWRLFDPEHDANDALLAAEKFGLFEPGKHEKILLKDGKRGWIIADDCEDDCVFPYVATGVTFCQAICQSILRLHERRDGR